MLDGIPRLPLDSATNESTSPPEISLLWMYNNNNNNNNENDNDNDNDNDSESDNDNYNDNYNDNDNDNIIKRIQIVKIFKIQNRNNYIHAIP